MLSSSREPRVWVVSSLPYLTPRVEGQADAWAEEASAAGRSGTQVIRAAGLQIPPAEVELSLSLPEGAGRPGCRAARLVVPAAGRGRDRAGRAGQDPGRRGHAAGSAGIPG